MSTKLLSTEPRTQKASHKCQLLLTVKCGDGAGQVRLPTLTRGVLKVGGVFPDCSLEVQKFSAPVSSVHSLGVPTGWGAGERGKGERRGCPQAEELPH